MRKSKKKYKGSRDETGEKKETEKIEYEDRKMQREKKRPDHIEGGERTKTAQNTQTGVLQ